ncbi:hypothetical protein [Salibaculum griseiflavum]|uniref:Uncharacterized protein n=1 Tax=Salibaculum griseiflavum TaxID=1914409 RepID=A0A2V1P6W8_9RHOB|nr:hypothetical protein [Salibaculum griseiflavum]PWG17540.1 hypothetical protein DFK10_07005 [Salibaculum griseiflavum]
MSDISDFETRISAALDRIRKASENVSASGAKPAPDSAPDTAELEAMRTQLDEERTANAQLEERVKLLKQRQDGKLSELESAVEANRKRTAGMDRELQRLRQVNAELRDINDQLRRAVEAGVSEPHLVNKAMMAELDALRATRAADAAEMDAIIGELRPIIEQEADDAAG